MKKITIALLATVASVGLMSSAFAADLIVEEPVADYPVALGSIWDGPFIGVFVGGGWGEADHIPGPGFPGDPAGNDLDLSGWLVGVDAGWNFALGGGGGLVVGVVGDIAWTDISGSDDFGGGFGEIQHSIDWTASLRGRLGWDGGQWMPYLTAGVAWAHATRESVDIPDSADATHTGWTAGVGVEVAVTEELSVDLQWRWNDYGEEEYVYGSSPTVSLTSSTLTAGLHWNF